MRRPLVDLALALAVLAGATLLFVGAADLPPPRFEPMGSAALPRILGALLTMFATIIGVRAVWRLRTGAGETDEQAAASGAQSARTGDDGESEGTDESDAPAPPPNAVRTLSVLAALVLYVVALDLLGWPFVPVTAAFVLALGTLLTERRVPTLCVFAVYGLGLAVTLHAVFTRFLYVSL